MKMDYQQRNGDAWEALYPRITEMKKIKHTQKKLDMKMDYQQRYGDAWEALYPRITEMQK